MEKTIINAGSQVVNNGVLDLSRRGGTVIDDNVPQHCPKSFTFAQRGHGTIFGGIAEIQAFLGTETFNGESKFFNHQTSFIELFGTNGNKQMVTKVYPDDIGPKANALLSLEVLQVTVPNYKRQSDGSIVLDPDTEEPVLDPTTPSIPGTKMRWLLSVDTDPLGFETGSRGITTGQNESTIFPIGDIPAMFKGSDYNNSGFIISSIPEKNKDARTVREMKSLIYNLQYVRRVNERSSHTVTPSKSGGLSSPFTLNGTKHPATKKVMSVENAMKNYYNLTETKYPISYNEFEDIYLYKDNIDAILTLIINNEKDYITAVPKVWNDNIAKDTLSWFDYTTDKAETLINDEKYLTNLFTGHSSKGVKYFTVEMMKDSVDLDLQYKLITFGNNSPIWLANGTDGTLTEEKFEDAVALEINKYLNPNSNVQDTAVNVETHLWDSGFNTKIKDIMPYFAAVRKNTMWHLATYIDNKNKPMTLEEDYDMATYLAVKAAVFPESEYYGTKACRGTITIGSGMAKTSSYTRRLPQTYEIANKVSGYMGAANGEWKKGGDFSTGEKNIVESMTDIYPVEIPNNMKEMLWDAQVNWSQSMNRRTFFYPAIQTIYPYDDSILNSFFNMAIICNLQTVADKVWRLNTGNYRDPKAVFKKKVEDDFKKDAYPEKYDNAVPSIVPDLVFTEEDDARGYSWTLNVSIYGNVAKTVQSVAVFAYRAE